MPYPLESKFVPTFMVSHGFLMLVYSFKVDSTKYAYLPFFSRTLAIPSWFFLTNTEGVADVIYAHIRSYMATFEF